MSWSPEENAFANEFLRKHQARPTAVHDEHQLDYLETQLGKAQAGLTGEGDVQTFSYTTQDKRLFGMPYYPIKQAVDRKFINGMVKVAQALRRNAR